MMLHAVFVVVASLPISTSPTFAAPVPLSVPVLLPAVSSNSPTSPAPVLLGSPLPLVVWLALPALFCAILRRSGWGLWISALRVDCI